MARNTYQQIRKEKDIELKYNALCKQHPHWKESYVLQKVAEEFYISARTVYAVIAGEYARNRAKAAKHQTSVLVAVQAQLDF